MLKVSKKTDSTSRILNKLGMTKIKNNFPGSYDIFNQAGKKIYSGRCYQVNMFLLENGYIEYDD